MNDERDREARPTAPAEQSADEAVAAEREALEDAVGGTGPEDEQPVLRDGKRPGEDSAQ